MLLAIDIGNTNIVLGVFEGDKLIDRWPFSGKRSSHKQVGIPFKKWEETSKNFPQ